jgi:hypothetical protein
LSYSAFWLESEELEDDEVFEDELYCFLSWLITLSNLLLYVITYYFLSLDDAWVSSDSEFYLIIFFLSSVKKGLIVLLSSDGCICPNMCVS